MRASLEDAMNAHRKAMDDNERLLDDLRQANARIRKLEEEKMQLEGDLTAKEDLLQAMNEDSNQQNLDVTEMERALAEKDEIIKSLGDSRNNQESENVRLLKESLNEAREETRLHKKTEKKLKDEMSRLQTHLQRVVEECETLSADLERKKAEIIKLGSGEVQRLRAEVNRLEGELKSKDESHDAEVEGMRLEVKKLTTALHDRDSAMATMSEQSSSMEQQLRTESEFLQKRSAELQVCNAQIEALRLENRHLRQTILQQAHTNADKSQSEDHLKALHNSYSTTVARLEKENQQLKDDCTYLREEMNEMEEKFEEQLQSALREAEVSSNDERRFHRIEEDANNKLHMMQERMDSAAQRYEEEISLLRTQKARLENQLDRRPVEQHDRRPIDQHDRRPVNQFDRRPVYSAAPEERVPTHYNNHQRYENDMTNVRHNGNHNPRYEEEYVPVRHSRNYQQARYPEEEDARDNPANQSFETVLSSKAMSISESVNGYYDPDDREVQNSRNSVSQKFLESENRRAKDLEFLIDSHIEQLKLGTEKMIKKNKR
ncbi:hypothetical protein KUTeg_012305 [Tegillarca granosa]|uniref:CEP63/Deup1 CEP152 binding coiled coil domain-containing protein n=1 Tax=Tegillarca granosa TaxID=220873 RepID=A0ABQ9F4A5_TEGGR|nr:hypothetical protein KUTeg_012305 [Tegillarca granosa]